LTVAVRYVALDQQQRLEFRMRDTLLIVHILGVATWFGANMVQMFVTPRMSRAGNAVAADWQRTVVAMGKVLYPVAAVAVLLTGFGLLGTSNNVFSLSDTFVIVGIVMVVVGAVLGMAFFGPQGEKAAAAYTVGDNDGGTAIVRKVAGVGALDTALLVVTIAAMVTMWGI
jgi:uncharacterized membrane protein